LNVIATDPLARALARSHYGELARIGKALGSPVRLQLLDLLRQGARTVESLADQAGISVANSSQHLQQMRAARLVSAERKGKHVEYRLADESVSEAFGTLRELAELLLPEMYRLRRELGVLEPAEREDVLAQVRAGTVTLLDVRPAEEFEAGHLPGARSVPLAELADRLREIPRDREVVAYCRGPYCTMATEAAALLRAAGFSARHLDLGVPDLSRRRVRSSASPRPRRADAELAARKAGKPR
jgi:rhodanese-related sulfurtransferase/DNA-binding transcriptional ArsR family regulator